MRVPLEWLREFVPYEGSVEELAERLTLAGLEVEAIERPGSAFDGVVIGEVLEAGPHPNADRLSLCQVTTGEGPVSIVCGAPNVAAGQRVAVATPGANLPGGVTIKKTKIRGEVSNGMICSEIELGLGDDRDGIMVLAPDAPVGAPFAEWAGLDDEILEIAVNPNRPDAMSIYGIARDVAALFDLPLAPYGSPVSESGAPASDEISVSIEDLEGCPRYCARLVRGVTVGPSPGWLSRRLRAAGMRPINVIVDITNYIMLEAGQPQHAFDRHQVAGGNIVVRRARAAEKLTTLDGVDRTLDEDMLLITDGERPLALAGVIGGADSEISPGTTDILLESATFDPVRTAIAGGRLGVLTESRRRFERGCDPVMAAVAADRAAALMAELAGGAVAPGIVEDGTPGAASPRTIQVEKPRIDALLGKAIPDEEATGLLERIGFRMEEADDAADGTWTVTIPTWRPDVEGEAHVAEELARLYGYDALGSDPSLSGVPPAGSTPLQRLREALRDALAGAGLHEIVTPALVDPATPHPLAPGAEPVELANPQSSDRSVLRTDLLGSGLDVLSHNLRRQQEQVRLFEIAPVYAVRDGAVSQGERVLVLLTGGRTPEPWASDGAPIDYSDLKGLLEGLFGGLHLDTPRTAAYDGPAFTAGAGARILLDGADAEQPVGCLGSLAPEVLAAWDLETPVWCIDLDLETLATLPRSSGGFIGLPRYPASDRDLSLTLPEAQPLGPVLDRVREGGGVEKVTLIDEYRGDQIEAGRKGVTLSVRFRDPDKTLTDNEIEKLFKVILEDLTGTFDARLRG